MSHLPNVYTTIDIADLSNVDFSQVGETSENTIRKSIDELLFVLKWEDEHEPTFIADGTIVPIQTMSHSECVALMSTEEWTEPMPEPE